MNIMKNRLLAVLSVLTFLCVIIIANNNSVTPDVITPDININVEDNTEITDEEYEIEYEHKDERDLNKTGTLDNLTFIVDVTEIHNKTDYRDYVIVGNTATKKYYSGEIHIITDKIEGIQINKTYKFIVEPLITISNPPEAKCVIYYEASVEDIVNLHETRESVSNYDKCIQKYKNLELEDVITQANTDYTVWTNEEINDYIIYIADRGYTEECNVKSIVKIISTPELLQ